MAKRIKLAVTDVYILQQVIMWEGNLLLDVCASPEVAKENGQVKGETWREEVDTEEGGTYWTTLPENAEPYDSGSWYIISKHPIRSK